MVFNKTLSKFLVREVFLLKSDISRFFNSRAWILFILLFQKWNLRVLRKLAISGQRINVYFLVSQFQLFSNWDLYHKFDSSRFFQPHILVFPNQENTYDNPSTSYLSNMEAFKDLRVVGGLDGNLDLIQPSDVFTASSLIFYEQPAMRLSRSWSVRRLSLKHLVVYIPYNLKLTRSNQSHFNLEIHNTSWILFAESKWHKKQYGIYGKRFGKNVVATGSPKMDAFFGNAGNQFPVSYKPGNRRIVIWAPHWSFSDTELGLGTFDRYFEFFIQLSDKYSEIDWFLRPHPRLVNQVLKSGLMREDEIMKYFQKWNGKGNRFLLENADYSSVFVKSWALITDSGSFLGEYLPTGRPVLLLRSSNSIEYNHFGSRIVANYDSAQSEDEITQFIDIQLMQVREEHGAVRRGLVSELFPMSTKPSDAIFSIVKDRVNL